MDENLERNLALELMRATEAGAMAAASLVGRGDKNRADGAAVYAMRLALSYVDMDGVVVIGEGEKDEAPMLYTGEQIGNGQPPQVDIAVDPVDGTRLLSQGLPNALSVVALAERGALYSATGIFYMNKLAVGPEAKGAIDLDQSVEWNLRSIAKAKGVEVSDLTVAVLDRPRHEQLIREIRAAGARTRLLLDGDVAGTILVARPRTGVDALMGVGGAPEGVISACILKCLGGEMQCRLSPRDEAERERAITLGNTDLEKLLKVEDLVKGENISVALTGITTGDLVDGVKYFPHEIETHSLVMRSSSGTLREVRAWHKPEKLKIFTEGA